MMEAQQKHAKVITFIKTVFPCHSICNTFFINANAQVTKRRKGIKPDHWHPLGHMKKLDTFRIIDGELDNVFFPLQK